MIFIHSLHSTSPVKMIPPRYVAWENWIINNSTITQWTWCYYTTKGNSRSANL